MEDKLSSQRSFVEKLEKKIDSLTETNKNLERKLTNVQTEKA